MDIHSDDLRSALYQVVDYTADMSMVEDKRFVYAFVAFLVDYYQCDMLGSVFLRFALEKEPEINCTELEYIPSPLSGNDGVIGKQYACRYQ